MLQGVDGRHRFRGHALDHVDAVGFEKRHARAVLGHDGELDRLQGRGEVARVGRVRHEAEALASDELVDLVGPAADRLAAVFCAYRLGRFDVDDARRRVGEQHQDVAVRLGEVEFDRILADRLRGAERGVEAAIDRADLLVQAAG